MIDDQEFIYFCLFAFNFSSNVLVLFSNTLWLLLLKGKLLWQAMFILDLPLLLDLMICMLVTLEKL